MTDYNWKDDSIKSWIFWPRFMRKKGVREGKFEPGNDDERRYLEGCKEGEK